MPSPRTGQSQTSYAGIQDNFGSNVIKHFVLFQRSLQQEHEQSVDRRESPLRMTICTLQEENQELRKQLGIPLRSMIDSPMDLQSLDALAIFNAPKASEVEACLKNMIELPSQHEGWTVPGQALLVVPSRLSTNDNEPEAEKDEDILNCLPMRLSELNGASAEQLLFNGVSKLEDRKPTFEEAGDVEGDGEEDLFRIWPEWAQSDKITQADRLGSDFSRTEMVKALADSEAVKPSHSHSDTVTTSPSHFYPRFVMSPSSSFLIFWNITFTIVLVYELLMLPMSAFAVPKTGIYLGLSFSCMMFWTLDLILTMNTGFYTNEGVVKHLRKEILPNYAKGWLVPDVFLVSIDWLEFTGLSGSALKGGKAIRAFRVMRVLRILRMRKLRDVLQQFDEFINSQYFTIICSMVVNVAAILMISHFLGCLWFIIGRVDIEGYPSWVKMHGFVDADWEYQYLTSLHWSITQFTPGSMHIQPQNILERSFAIAVLVAGMIIFSSIVSSITAATNGLKSMNAEYKTQMYFFRCMCRDQALNKDLLKRIIRYSENHVKPRMNKVQFRDVALMKQLPKTFQQEVHIEVYGKHLKVHPLFDALSERECLAAVCSSALDDVLLDKGEVLFSPGDQAHAMHFLVEGQLQYHVLKVNPNHTDLTDGKVEFSVLQGRLDRHRFKEALSPRILTPEEEFQENSENLWFGEAVLWTPWIFQGSMVAKKAAVLMAVHSKTFRNCLAEHRGMYMVLTKYAKAFVKAMNEQAGLLTDTDEDDTNLSDVLTIESAIWLLSAARTSGSGSSLLGG